MTDLRDALRHCTLCQDRFAATATAHAPRPVVWFEPQARVLIAGQAPGMRVHLSGRPFTDPSGDRLRDWLGLDQETFYDQSRIAIVPMAFCFPGYDARGSDLPPPPVCSASWREGVLAMLDQVRLTILVGSYAARYHLGRKMSLTAAARDWRPRGDDLFVLPHPSWRNNAWLKKNPWFAQDVLPRLRTRVQEVLA
ncbi:uracil-DNA glycosylase family protein [uncultured Roseobacter sp.]|uniref:uracil-DNA glycosylase family protein n=1 Tax=uncultured Roseobacter sp. TaxID=114847 RepID=UPI00262E1951|nr:uracil-DNA glycosylase family protein [uncultured Roseobacter sp.]